MCYEQFHLDMYKNPNLFSNLSKNHYKLPISLCSCSEIAQGVSTYTLYYHANNRFAKRFEVDTISFLLAVRIINGRTNTLIVKTDQVSSSPLESRQMVKRQRLFQTRSSIVKETLIIITFRNRNSRLKANHDYLISRVYIHDKLPIM